MLLNNEQSLASNPINLNIRRSKFHMAEEHQLDFSSGELIPVYVNLDVLPGDTINMRMSSMIRLSTPIYPTMDTAYADFWFFFVPKRLVWEHFKDFKGENSNTYWTTPVEYTTPQIEAPANGWNVNSVADYFGIVPEVDGFSVDALPFRAYALCWNEWFRSESLTQPVSISFGDATVTGTNGTWTNYITDGSLGGSPLRVARFHDLFSSGLFEPQAGGAAQVPLGLEDSYVPVITGVPSHLGTNPQLGKEYRDPTYAPLSWMSAGPGPNTTWSGGTQSDYSAVSTNGSGTKQSSTAMTNLETYSLAPANLYAAMGYGNAGITIESLRQAFAIQRILETINRGSRYIEIIKNAFGVTSPDSRQQRPEYLGGRRVPIQMAEINQTSSTDSTSPLGQPGAASKTLSSDDYFTYSATEHGILLGLMAVRPVHSYAQGIKRDWRKRTKWEYYWPDLANIGDQYIKNSEIFMQSDSVVDSDGNVVNDLPFAYQEAWYEYRNGINQVHGHLRPQVNQSLAVWNYADEYTSLPTLSTDWLYEDGSQIGRTIAVQSQPQFIADLYFDPIYTRPMPLYSVPGLDTRF